MAFDRSPVAVSTMSNIDTPFVAYAVVYGEQLWTQPTAVDDRSDGAHREFGAASRPASPGVGRIGPNAEDEEDVLISELR
jgi:hypothetical protein